MTFLYLRNGATERRLFKWKITHNIEKQKQTVMNQEKPNNL